MSSLRLREFLAGDLEAAYGLDQICFEPGIAYSRSELRGFLARAGSVALVAEDGGTLAGFAIGHRRGAKGHIVTIDIAPGFRRRGAGRILLAELLRRLEEEGARAIRLEVDARNTGAIRFYEQMGFRATRILKDYYDEGIDGREMVRGG
jgi:[ribosomal protein S18]-alanine N-acetyltransferase